jgi:hypothetical protein
MMVARNVRRLHRIDMRLYCQEVLGQVGCSLFCSADFQPRCVLRILTLATGIGCFLVGGLITFAIIRAIGKGSPELAFVMGAVLGTQVAAVVHHRQSGTTNSLAVKLSLGLALAVGAIVLGSILHVIFSPFEYPEISIPIAAVGSFVFPFVLFDTMWKTLSKAKTSKAG